MEMACLWYVRATSSLSIALALMTMIAEIITYLNAVSALLRPESQVTAAKADIVMIALHVTRSNLPTIEQPHAPGLSAVKDLLDTMTDLLQRSAELSNDRRILPLRQDWCTILAEMMTVSSSARPQDSVVPPGLASAVLQCLGRPPDDEWHTWVVLSISDGSRLSAMVIDRLAHVFGGAGDPSTAAAAADPGTHIEPPAPVTGESLV
jgi:hypothetical protein